MWVSGRSFSVTGRKAGLVRNEMLMYDSCRLYWIKTKLSRLCFSRTVELSIHVLHSIFPMGLLPKQPTVDDIAFWMSLQPKLYFLEVGCLLHLCNLSLNGDIWERTSPQSGSAPTVDGEMVSYCLAGNPGLPWWKTCRWITTWLIRTQLGDLTDSGWTKWKWVS